MNGKPVNFFLPSPPARRAGGKKSRAQYFLNVKGLGGAKSLGKAGQAGRYESFISPEQEALAFRLSQ